MFYADCNISLFTRGTSFEQSQSVKQISPHFLILPTVRLYRTTTVDSIY